MISLDEDNYRYLFQLIKNNVDRLQQLFKELQLENTNLKKQIESLTEHAILDTTGQEGEDG